MGFSRQPDPTAGSQYGENPDGNLYLRQAEPVNLIELGDLAPFAAITVAIWLPGALAGLGGIWATASGTASLLSAVASGFIAGGISTGTLKGAFMGAFSAGMFYGIGSSFQERGWAREFFGSAARGAKVVAHGLAGGVMSVLNGGKFGNGFISAGFTQLLAPGIGKIDKGTRFSPKRIFAASIVGGTSSAMTGGKFANGAVTGAFSRAFNDALHGEDYSNKVVRNVGDKEFVMDGITISEACGSYMMCRASFKASVGIGMQKFGNLYVDTGSSKYKAYSQALKSEGATISGYVSLATALASIIIDGPLYAGVSLYSSIIAAYLDPSLPNLIGAGLGVTGKVFKGIPTGDGGTVDELTDAAGIAVGTACTIKECPSN